MTEEQIKLILEAAQALQDACIYKYERLTEYSCADRMSWTYEQQCRYGSDSDYELSLKLTEFATSEKISIT